jgi:hypothetical protein
LNLMYEFDEVDNSKRHRAQGSLNPDATQLRTGIGAIDSIVDDLEAMNGYAEKGKFAELDRKIPGPAGDLSHLRPEDFLEDSLDSEQDVTTLKLRDKNRRREQRKRKYVEEKDDSPAKTQEKLTPQDLANEISSWKEMVKYVCRMSKAKINPLEGFNFKYITEQRGYITPVKVLGIVIRHVISYETNAAAWVLVGEYDYNLDGSGDNLTIDVKPSNNTLKANISKSAIDKWKAITTSGSVVLLRKVPVFKPSPDSYSLIITADNVLNLWASDAKLLMAEGKQIRKKSRSPQSSQQSVTTTHSSSLIRSVVPTQQSEGILDIDIYSQTKRQITAVPHVKVSPPSSQEMFQTSTQPSHQSKIIQINNQSTAQRSSITPPKPIPQKVSRAPILPPKSSIPKEKPPKRQNENIVNPSRLTSGNPVLAQSKPVLTQINNIKKIVERVDPQVEEQEPTLFNEDIVGHFTDPPHLEEDKDVHLDLDSQKSVLELSLNDSFEVKETSKSTFDTIGLNMELDDDGFL